MTDWQQKLREARLMTNVTIIDIDYDPFGGEMTETQKKTERMEARLTPAQKQAVRDALVDGETLTSFVEDAIAAHMKARGAEYPRNAEGTGAYQKKS